MLYPLLYPGIALHTIAPPVKRIETLQKFRKLFGVLVAAVAVALLILAVGLAHVLNQSRLRK